MHTTKIKTSKLVNDNYVILYKEQAVQVAFETFITRDGGTYTLGFIALKLVEKHEPLAYDLINALDPIVKTSFIQTLVDLLRTDLKQNLFSHYYNGTLID